MCLGTASAKQRPLWSLARARHLLLSNAPRQVRLFDGDALVLMLRTKEHAIDEVLFVAGAENVFEAIDVDRHFVVDVTSSQEMLIASLLPSRTLFRLAPLFRGTVNRPNVSVATTAQSSSPRPSGDGLPRRGPHRLHQAGIALGGRMHREL